MLGNPHASEQEMLQALRISGALSLVQVQAGGILLDQRQRAADAQRLQHLLFAGMGIAQHQILPQRAKKETRVVRQPGSAQCALQL